MWMKRYGWDAICRDSDGEGSGGGSAENDIEAQAFGIGPVGPPEAEVDFSLDPGFGLDPESEVDFSQDPGFGLAPETDFSLDPSFGLFDPAFDPEEEEEDRGSLRGAVSRTLDKKKDPEEAIVGALLSVVAPPLGGLFSLGQGLRGLAEEFGGTVGPPDSPDSPDAPDGPGPDRQPPLARSVRPPRRNDVSGPGVPRSPAPAPPLDLPSSDIDEIRAELDAEREARRRRRRATRQSTIVTGPLGVMGRPELLRPTAIAGASRRLLGQ